MTTETRTKHTPGPWQVSDEIFVDGPDGKGIFGGASTRRPDEENAANARLIAAVPELLEACKVAYAALPNDVRVASDWHAVAIALESAIAHATGEQP